MAEEGCCENGESRVNERTRCIWETVDDGGVESKRFYLARTTAFEMLRDRGYEVNEAEMSLSLSEFRSVFGEKPDLEHLRICVPLRSDPRKKILVVFMESEPITVKTIRVIHSQISNNVGVRAMILILQSKMNHFAQKELTTFPFPVETFPIGDLLVNITKHIQQPKIEVLTKKEKEQLLKKHSLEDKHLPYLQESDSFVRYYGLKKKQVVKITYSKEPVGSFVTYRCII
ncbi:PREDICTED: DNA-directed RNA polymerase V subunit 5C-like [Camelina sativa]|uniref:DNA-directed RNA polymerase V subunit 5C-like n=1 Tax=Camelina sativa TaxID=90675 RepID=A0ABM0TJ44_CAMSA|nr:PREDICTED: DNA-directed RNA polymerase V subunit 5C-like [Camelina sativa]